MASGLTDGPSVGPLGNGLNIASDHWRVKKHKILRSRRETRKTLSLATNDGNCDRLLPFGANCVGDLVEGDERDRSRNRTKT